MYTPSIYTLVLHVGNTMQVYDGVYMVCFMTVIWFITQTVAVFTRLRFQHKNEHLVTILAFRLHANDENAHAK